MAACEECWSNAFIASKIQGGSQVEHYYRLLTEHADHEVINKEEYRHERQGD